MTTASNGLSKPSLVIRLFNRTEPDPAVATLAGDHQHSTPIPYPHLDLSQLALPPTTTPSPVTVNSSVPYPSANLTDSQAINATQDSLGAFIHWWKTSIYTHPDVLLAFALLCFYCIFILFILVIVIRIVFTIIFTGSSFKMTAPSSDGYSDTIEGDTSSRTRGYSQSGYSQSRSKGRRFPRHEMTSFAVDRTNSPSIIDEEEDES